MEKHMGEVFMALEVAHITHTHILLDKKLTRVIQRKLGNKL